MTAEIQIDSPPRRWTFSVPTPLGITECSYEIMADGLLHESDDPLGHGAELLSWESIREGATAEMAGMGGRGAPDLPGWVPEKVEWLVFSRLAGRGKDFMGPLPQSLARDALVAEIKGRLGSRWLGEHVPLREAHRRMGIASAEWSGAKVAGMVVGVLALLVLSLVLLLLLLTPVFLVPLCLLGGGWLLRKGVRAHRASKLAASMPTVALGQAGAGPVHLQARALAPSPLVAPASGRACVWWDVSVALWYEGDRDTAGAWRQVASRHGGNIDSLTLVDDTGTATLWLPGAERLLAGRSWESDQDELPAGGIALLDELGFPWRESRNQQIRVHEECLEAGMPLQIYGVLDRRRDLPIELTARWPERIVDAVRSGSWRRTAVAAAPKPLRSLLAVFIGFLDLFARVGTARDRAPPSRTGVPPDLPDDAWVVWKGAGEQPFLVSDREPHEALAALRRRAFTLGVIGAGLLVLAFYGWVA